MDIRLLTDLIKDERGNYYVAVAKEGTQLTLVNALVERSYQTLLEFNEDFAKAYAEYDHQFIGKITTDILRHDVVFAQNERGDSRLYDLETISRTYQLTFIDSIEFYRHPRAARA
ncbi:hypothetical protein [Paenibacillus xerothermodurans]|uniref:Uncharacterized protein n=1 Tax=Paenibacillus xerothermodurans TaxID=1977292 RepID=A0A2W1NCJ4_PAEXE|nr:hypothetical protein [Paenibacillus xerothermodurans]PZE21684.1 hypothetical protein CBW46_004490 [Paenibacillus xerothermodurans]